MYNWVLIRYLYYITFLMKPLIDELEKAEKHEQFLNDKSNFRHGADGLSTEMRDQIYDKHTICIEGRRKYRAFGSRKKWWVDEYRFNEKKYEAAVRCAQGQVKNCERKINDELWYKEAELRNLKSKGSEVEENIFDLDRKISNVKHEDRWIEKDNANEYEKLLYGSTNYSEKVKNQISQAKNSQSQVQKEIASVNSQISYKKTDISRLETQRNQIHSKLTERQKIKSDWDNQLYQQKQQNNSISNQITNLRAEQHQNQNKVTATVNLNQNLSNELDEKTDESSKKLEELKSNLVNLSEQERSLIVHHLLNKDDQHELIGLCNSLKIDSTYLAHLAIGSNSKKSFEMALNMGADFGSLIADKTLLQICISNGQNDFATKIINANNHLNVSLMNSLAQNDMQTFNMLLNLRANLVKENFHGLSLLHTAVAMNKIEAARKIIVTDQSAITDLDAAKFKQTLKRADEVMQNELQQYFNIDLNIDDLQQEQQNLSQQKLEQQNHAENNLQTFNEVEVSGQIRGHAAEDVGNEFGF